MAAPRRSRLVRPAPGPSDVGAVADFLSAGLAAVWLVTFATLTVPDRTPSRLISPDAAARALLEAARLDDLAGLRAALASGADADAPGPDGATALHWAVDAGDREAAELLVDHGADPRRATREGATPMSLAALNGDAVMMAALLDAGADIRERLAHGETLLMLAARSGRPEAVELLIARGADVDAAEELRGTTALMWAAAAADPEAVAALLSGGADVAARSKPVTLGRGPYLADTARDRIADFHRGVGQAGQAIAVSLTADGEDLDQSTLVDPTIAAAARVAREAAEEERREEVQLRGEGGGLTALVFAAREGDLEVARLLLDAGADVNQTTQYGWAPLLAAVQNRRYRLAADLLERGADPNLANRGGWTPLYLAVDNRNIEAGDYPTRRPDMDHMALISLLLDNGADPNLRMASSTETRTIFTHQWLYEEGATPFLRASQSGDLDLMRLLLEHGADPSIPTDAGVTALMVASGIGWVEGVTYEWSPEQTREAVALLLELGADVNAQDWVDGRTALMGAAHKGRTDVIELLVGHGANLTLHDIGSRDSIHVLYGATWQAVDYADGLVRVGVQSATPRPEAAALLRRLMRAQGLAVPPTGRTLESICVTELCRR